MNKVKFLFAAVAMMMVLSSFAEEDESQWTKDLLPVGTEAPDFILANGESHAGEALSSFRGTYVVIDFWASYCIDCRRDLPEFKAVQTEYDSKEIVFIGVSFDRSEEAWRNYLKENGMTWIQHWETTPWKESPITAGYHLKWIPTIYVLDTEGKVAFTTIHASELKSFLATLKQ